MTDRPIPFSAPMVRALLDGRKTQTRRILTPQPEDLREGKIPRQLKVAIGDRLWVREAWRAAAIFDGIPPREIPHGSYIFYQAGPNDCIMNGWARPGIIMPRWASRLTLVVTEVRVQQLWAISEDDARAEGAYVGKSSGRVADDYVSMAVAGAWFASGRRWYADLWDRINGPGAFAANPFVAVYSFEVQGCNIDALEAR